MSPPIAVTALADIAFDPRCNDRPLEVLSLGAGVDSTALTVASVAGLLPPLDYAVFADTGWEPRAVYENLARLNEFLTTAGVTVLVVSAGNIRDDALDPDHAYASMPLHLRSLDGRPNGFGRRQCTHEYKLKPVQRTVRRLLGGEVRTLTNGVTSVGRIPARTGRRTVRMWVGISTSEVERIRPSGLRYITRWDPLVDQLGWSRAACEKYLTTEWPHPVGKSSCIGCPYHSNIEWRSMKRDRPDEWDDAVAFDAALRTRAVGALSERVEPYLHADRVPLSEVNVERTTSRERRDAQGELFEGCSPWGCTSGSNEPTPVQLTR